MAAVPLTPTRATGPNGPFPIAAPKNVTARIGLLALITVDSGGVVGISGGGQWQRIGHVAGPTTHLSGVDVWWRMGTDAEPASYMINQASSADGVAFIVPLKGAHTGPPKVIPGNVVTNSPAVVTPGGIPDSPSGCEIRFVGGIPDEAHISWSQPISFQELGDLQSDDEISGAVCWRPITSTAPIGQVAHVVSGLNNVQYGGGLTILVRSGADAEPPPTPIPFPPFTPVLGLSRINYTALDLLTGEFLGDLPTLSGVTMDRRDGDQGALSGTIPLPSDLEAGKINEIFPADEYDLDAGVGRTVIRAWRDEQLWGEYWAHTAVERRNERGHVELQIQAVTLDGYLNHVALLEPIELFEGDQIANGRALLGIALADPGSNIGLTLQGGVSGVDRPLAADKDAYIGQVLRQYAATEQGFEYVLNPRVVNGAIVRSWEWGHPRLDYPDVVHEFVEALSGGDIVAWDRTASVLSGHTRLGVIGGVPAQSDASTTSTPTRSTIRTATAHRNAGWPWIDKRLRHPSPDPGTIEAFADYWASRTPGAPRVFQTTVLLGSGSSFDPNGLGQYARITLNNPRYPIRNGQPTFDKTMRIIGWQLQPGERGRGKDRLTLITEHQVVN